MRDAALGPCRLRTKKNNVNDDNVISEHSAYELS